MPKWEQKLNKEEIKVYIKKDGSKIDKDNPYIKTEVVFNSYFLMEKIIKAIFVKENRIQWDKNILGLETKELSNGFSKIVYQLNKSPLNFANRDFVDKHVRFANNGVVYTYYSACPDSETLHPVPAKVERAKTIIGLQKMERRKSDGKIVYTMYMQGDLNMKQTTKLLGMFLPTGMQDWQRKL